METVLQEILRPDPESPNWLAISLFAFRLRHPDAVVAKAPTPPTDLAEAMRRFTRYGYELAVLEDDLADCINELGMACDYYYADHLELKKFAVVYHVDNFYVRVSKLIENTYRLLALVAGLDHDRQPQPRESPFKTQVKNGLNERGLQEITGTVRTLERNKWVRQALDARNLFVHRYREEPGWPMLGPEARLQGAEEDEDAMAAEVRQIDQATDLDRYAKRKSDDLSQTLTVIRLFREELYRIFLTRVSKLKSMPQG